MNPATPTWSTRIKRGCEDTLTPGHHIRRQVKPSALRGLQTLLKLGPVNDSGENITACNNNPEICCYQSRSRTFTFYFYLPEHLNLKHHGRIETIFLFCLKFQVDVFQVIAVTFSLATFWPSLQLYYKNEKCFDIMSAGRRGWVRWRLEGNCSGKKFIFDSWPSLFFLNLLLHISISH